MRRRRGARRTDSQRERIVGHQTRGRQGEAERTSMPSFATPRQPSSSTVVKNPSSALCSAVDPAEMWTNHRKERKSSRASAGRSVNAWSARCHSLSLLTLTLRTVVEEQEAPSDWGLIGMGPHRSRHVHGRATHRLRRCAHGHWCTACSLSVRSPPGPTQTSVAMPQMKTSVM